MPPDQNASNNRKTPLWLYIFSYGLMGPACAINAVFIAIGLKISEHFGITGLYLAAVVGALIGVLPAIWLARKINEGISEKS
ncbi:MAG: hypothetical protein H6875_10065 [Hyphomicrobiaceae bacterium]|nr:hypothetical protein [Hyphomicrobiaceae bacterium]